MEQANMGADIAEAILSLPGDLPRQVMDEFRRGWNREKVEAFVSQDAIGAANQRLERTWMDGAGQVVASVDLGAYHYWGQRLGYDCWKDKQFRNEFLRDNPGARVRSVAPKTSLRVQGNRAGSSSTGGLILTNRFGR